MKKNKYAVYFTTDLNYWKHSFVAIKSLFEFNNSIDVFLIFHGLNKNILSKFTNFFGKKLKLIKFKDNDFKKINGQIKGFYFRYFIPKQLEKYDKILYLDSDTIVLRNINKIFDIKLNKTLAAVKEPFIPIQKKLYIGNPQTRRFNSGVLLINTKKFKSKKYLKKIIKYSKIYKDKWGDQPIVNFVLRKDVKYIDGKWNYLDKTNSKKISKKNILHFNNFKPWKINHNSKYVELYRKHRRSIENFYLYDDINFKNLIKKIINKF